MHIPDFMPPLGSRHYCSPLFTHDKTAIFVRGTQKEKTIQNNRLGFTSFFLGRKMAKIYLFYSLTTRWQYSLKTNPNTLKMAST